MGIKGKIASGFTAFSLLLLLVQGTLFWGLKQTSGTLPQWLTLAFLGGSVLLFIMLALLAAFLLREDSQAGLRLSQQIEALVRGNFSASLPDDSSYPQGSGVVRLQKQLTAYFEGLIRTLDQPSGQTMRLSSEAFPGDYQRLADAILRRVEQNDRLAAQSGRRAQELSQEQSALSQSAASFSSHAQEQSSQVREFEKNLARVAALTRGDSENAARVKEISNQASLAVEQSEHKMEQMTESMDRISRSSEEIGKVIKIIEDIAFQTNILALNAAVEAARAGSAGKGFAVVADEVRRLAAKSSEATGEITQIVVRSKQLIGEGTETALLTASSLKEVGTQVDSMSAALQNIDASTAEQASAFARMQELVEQLNRGISQILAVSGGHAQGNHRMYS